MAGKVEIGYKKQIMKSQMMKYEKKLNWAQTHNRHERIKSAHVSALVEKNCHVEKSGLE